MPALGSGSLVRRAFPRQLAAGSSVPAGVCAGTGFHLLGLLSKVVLEC